MSYIVLAVVFTAVAVLNVTLFIASHDTDKLVIAALFVAIAGSQMAIRNYRKALGK